MNCFIASDAKFVRNAQGKPASVYQSYERAWKRYLDIFESVTILGRLFPQQQDPAAEPVEGLGVRFVALPGYTGVGQLIRNLYKFRKHLRECCNDSSAYILRSPGAVSSLVYRFGINGGQPYGVEVLNDPVEIMAPGVSRHPFRPFWKWWYPRQLREQCRYACAASYVTDGILQKRYPCRGFSIEASNVDLEDDDFVTDPRRDIQLKESINVITIASLDMLNKGQDVLLQAIAECRHRNRDVRLVVVGDGTFRHRLESLAQNLGISQAVRFCGQMPSGPGIHHELDQADLFALPSRYDGLPCALIEAMARAVPCIGANVGGVPELLPPQDMVEPGDVASLATKIVEVGTSPKRLAWMSARNLDRAQKFNRKVLREKRKRFYQEVCYTTEEWLRTQMRKQGTY